MISRHLPWGELGAGLEARADEMIELLMSLVEIESPSGDRRAQDRILDAVAAAAGDVGLGATRLEGSSTGDHLLIGRFPAEPGPQQLVVGHCDTVWPLGTLAERPAHTDGLRLFGPGAFDAKAGLVQALFAMQALDPSPVEPLLLVNSDEEIGSGSSRQHIMRLAAASDRVFVLEPSLGSQGLLKTARKGVARYTVTVTGRAAHAGLDPQRGVSAVLELSHVVQHLFSLNDPQRGVTVNVGTIDGGRRPNVVAETASAEADVRAASEPDRVAIDGAIRSLQPTVEGTRIAVTGGFGRPPMERSPGTAMLFEQAREIANALGFAVGEAAVGGGSDGNLTAALAPTLDGLGAVGDAAHAEDEHVMLSEMPRRSALLAGLLAQPVMEEATTAGAHRA